MFFIRILDNLLKQLITKIIFVKIAFLTIDLIQSCFINNLNIKKEFLRKSLIATNNDLT